MDVAGVCCGVRAPPRRRRPQAIANYMGRVGNLQGASDDDFAMSQMCLAEAEDIYSMLLSKELARWKSAEARASEPPSLRVCMARRRTRAIRWLGPCGATGALFVHAPAPSAFSALGCASCIVRRAPCAVRRAPGQTATAPTHPS